VDPKIKNYLGWTMIVVMIIVGFSFAKWVGSYSKSIDPSALRSFNVSADEKVIAIPDVAQFTFSVISQGGLDIAKLQQDNVGKTNKIISYLKSSGIKEEDIKTESFNLEPRYQYFSCPRDGGPCPPSEIVGYSVNQTVSVKSRDFNKSGEILAGVVQNGANSVSQLSFTIDDPTELQNKAREKAIEKAREKAKAIAKAGGFSLGQLISISEDGIMPFYDKTVSLEAYGRGGGGTLPAPSIEPGSQEVTVNVTLRYEIR